MHPSRAAMAELEQRCFAARLTIADFCARADVHPACFTRYRRGENIRVRTIGKLEEAMARIEADRT